MRTNYMILAVVVSMLSSGMALADHHEKHQLPKKPYDPTKPVGLDKPWEIGNPGKTAYDPTKKTTTRKGTTSKYNKTGAGSAKGGKYDPIERTTVLKYNTMVVEANKRLKTAGKLYGRALKPVFFDEEADLEEVKLAQQQLTDLVERVQKVMKAYNVPKTKGSDALNKAHMAFLNYQKEMVEGPLDKVMELLEDPNLKPEDKKEEIQKVLEDMRKVEVKHYLALKKAQDAYGEAHGIEIIRETIAQPTDGKPGMKKVPAGKGYYKKVSR